MRGDAVHSFDWTVGQIVMDALDRLKLADNTLLIVTSDNGGVLDTNGPDAGQRRHRRDQQRPPRTTARCAPARAAPTKAAPACRSSPAGPATSSPATSDALICHVDMLATLRRAHRPDPARSAGPDSFNVLPALLGRGCTGREHLVEHGGSLSLRLGTWKYLPPRRPGAARKEGKAKKDGPASRAELYDLAHDIGESQDVASQHLDIVEKMQMLLTEIQTKGRSRPISVDNPEVASVPKEGPATDEVVVISAGGLAVRFDAVGRQLRLDRHGKTFGTAAWLGADRVHKEPTPADSPFAPGTTITLGPGENRIVVREGAPFVFVRRDPRQVQATMPGRRVGVLEIVVSAEAEAARLKGVGPAGLFDPASNPGQHLFTAIADPATGAGIVAGVVKIDAASAVLATAVREGRVILGLRDEYGAAVPSGLSEFGGDWWAIGYFDDVRDGLEAYASEMARLHDIHLKPCPVGFMSWYAEKYGGALNEKAVVELAEFVSGKFKDYGYSFVQIDDLWQNGSKDHGPAKDFTKVNPQGPYAGGMKPVADRIASLGLTPGLWLLPFGINHTDPVMADRAHLAAKKPDGTPFVTNWTGTAIDLTRSDSLDYIRSVIRRAVNDWGYRYLKLDGLHIGMATVQTYPRHEYVEDGFGDVVFADKDKSNMQAGRAGLAAVREAAGAETFLLGCCVPQNMRSLGMVVGFVDAMRVGPDSAVTWGSPDNRTSVIGALRSATSLYFMNGRVWWNDPDAIYARASWPLNEVRCFAGWVALTGMLNNQTDWAPDYPAERVDLLRRTMPAHHSTRVRPVDFLENDPARIWLLSGEIGGEKYTVVGLFNWGDAEVAFDVPVERLGLEPAATQVGFEFWTNRLIDPIQGSLRRRVAARTAEIIAVRETAARPVLLSTSRHVTQGLVDVKRLQWSDKESTLLGDSLLVGGDPYELRVVMPHATVADQWRVKQAVVSNLDTTAGVTVDVKQEETLLRVTLLSPASRTVSWSVGFTRESQ